MRKWWLPKQKKYLAETKKWWCSCCQAVTSIERNPEWGGEFKGETIVPRWFVRCVGCKTEHMQSMGFDCPECGWDQYDPENPLKVSNSEYNMWAAIEYGGSPYDWVEHYHCPHCDEPFCFTNGNY